MIPGGIIEQMDIEKIRQSYRPLKVRILFIGESPPASGRFFYVSSNMTNHTRKAFEMACGTTFKDEADFLGYFKKSGCYLDDLSHLPVNKLEHKERRQILQGCVPLLGQRIVEMDPEVIVVVLKRLERYVREAINQSGRQFELHVLPFPGVGHQNRYIDGLRGILKKHLGGE